MIVFRIRKEKNYQKALLYFQNSSSLLRDICVYGVSVHVECVVFVCSMYMCAMCLRCVSYTCYFKGSRNADTSEHEIVEL